MALIAGACGNGDDSGDSSGDDKPAKASEADQSSAGERHTGAPEVPEECGAQEQEDDGALAAIKERGAPDPAEVVAEVGDGAEPVDLIEGDGETVIEDGTATVHYVIINPADNSQLESSWDAGAPVPIPVTEVFPEFAEAISGMKVGGRRVFMVPAKQVVGDATEDQTGVNPDGDLIFVVDLVSTGDAEAAAAAGPVEANDDALKAIDDRGAPEMVVPEGDAETKELVWIDDVVGGGDVVCPGDTVLAHYTGIQASDGEQFDSSWDRGEPSEFALDGVIPGWTEGLVGMKVGGRRTLVIPPDMAYGDDASGDGPSGVLVFTVDLVGVS